MLLTGARLQTVLHAQRPWEPQTRRRTQAAWACSTALVVPGMLDGGAETLASAWGTSSAAADVIANPMSGISILGMCSSIAWNDGGSYRRQDPMRYQGNPSVRGENTRQTARRGRWPPG